VEYFPSIKGGVWTGNIRRFGGRAKGIFTVQEAREFGGVVHEWFRFFVRWFV